MTETFWAIYCDFLKQLRDGSDEVLPEIVNSHEQSLAQQDTVSRWLSCRTWNHSAWADPSTLQEMAITLVG